MKYSYILIAMLSVHILTCQIIYPIGSGLTMSGTIYDMAFDKNTNVQYAVGSFVAIDGKEMYNVGIKKDGIWNALKDTAQVNGYVFCAEVINGELYIGGNFTINKELKIINIAKYSNGNWESLGIEFMSGSIRDIAWYHDKLYVCGDYAGINGIKNNGIMCYSNGTWHDSGLESAINSKGLFVSDDRLFCWGTGFNGSGGYSHTVSYLKNDQWIYLPKYNGVAEVSSACIVFKGQIYSIKGNQLFVYNQVSNKWDFKATANGISQNNRECKLYEHEGSLYALFNYSSFFVFNGSNVLDEFQYSYTPAFSKAIIYSIYSLEGNIYLGGNFHIRESKSVSLAIFDNEGNFVSNGKVASNISYADANNYSVGNSIVKYRNMYLISGRFIFANGIYSPNIVYWDGKDFQEFEHSLQTGIWHLEVFENNLYALPQGSWLDDPLIGFQLVKYNGSEWIGVDTPENVRNSEFEIIGDKLFFNDKSSTTSLHNDNEPNYLKNDVWRKLKAYKSNWPWYSYSNVTSYKNGYLMLVDDYPDINKIVYLKDENSEWEKIGLLGNEPDKIISKGEQLLLIDEWLPVITRLKNEKLDTLAQGRELDLSHAKLFDIKDDTCFSAWNEPLYKIQNDTLKYYMEVGIRDIEKIDENKYLVVSQSGSYDAGINRINLNKVGVLSFEPFEAELKANPVKACQAGYSQFESISDHIGMTFEWSFEGGTPSQSNVSYPMVKYNEQGIYDVKLKVKNASNDSFIITSTIAVEDCQNREFRFENYDNHYIMGYQYWNGSGLGGFDFSLKDSIISARYHSPVELGGGSIVMSDRIGNLQFYSNGRFIYNKENKKILGSECFNKDYKYSSFTSSQSMICLPKVDEEGVYLIFDSDPISVMNQYWAAGKNLALSIVDMNKNNGGGEMRKCNEEIILDTLLTCSLQATKHANGIDWWIIVGKYKSDEYYKILITNNGIQSIHKAKWNVEYNSTFSGQSTFSPDGKYFVQVSNEKNEVVIWKFNPENGVLSDNKILSILALDNIEKPQGCAFSSDSRFLYVSSLSYLRQIDLCNFDKIDVSYTQTWDGTYEFIYGLLFGKLMLTPNEKILVASYGNSHFSFGSIENPTLKGDGCNFKQHHVTLHERTRNLANVISSFPHYRSYNSYEGLCESLSIEDISHHKNFNVFPNPIEGTNILYLNKNTSGEVYSINGAKLFEFKNTDILDVKSLPTGIFFVRTMDGIAKIVKPN